MNTPLGLATGRQAVVDADRGADALGKTQA